MTKKRAYQSYSREFKVEAIALVTWRGYSVPEAAASLGIRSNQFICGSNSRNKRRTAAC